MEFKAGMTVFYLDKDCYNPNDNKQLIVECEVKDIKGRFGVIAKETIEGMEWKRLSCMIDDFNKNVNIDDFFFLTREAAQEKYDAYLSEEIAKFTSKSKEELLNDMFRRYFGEHIYDMKYFNAVKNKIEEEFGIKL